MTGQREELGTRGHVPELYRLVLASGGEQLAVRAGSHRVDLAQMAEGHERDLLARQLPDLDAAVHAGGDNELAVRAVGNGGHPVCVAAKAAELVAVLYVPNLHEPIAAGGHDRAAIGAERHGAEGAAMPGERDRIGSRLDHVPDLDEVVDAA